jgi:hypothetical protein
MAEAAFHPPLHLKTHPDEPIRTIEAAAKVVRRHQEKHQDQRSAEVLARLENVISVADAEAAGRMFGDWARSEGLLLVPPEDEAAGR